MPISKLIGYVVDNWLQGSPMTKFESTGTLNQVACMLNTTTSDFTSY